MIYKIKDITLQEQELYKQTRKVKYQERMKDVLKRKIKVLEKKLNVLRGVTYDQIVVDGSSSRKPFDNFAFILDSITEVEQKIIKLNEKISEFYNFTNTLTYIENQIFEYFYEDNYNVSDTCNHFKLSRPTLTKYRATISTKYQNYSQRN